MTQEQEQVRSQASEEAMNDAAREIATRIGGHDEDRCERMDDPRKDCTCPPDESFRIALEVLDRVSRERTRQALERAQAAICGYCRDAATWGAAVQNPGPTWNHGERYCAATPIRALSESVASAGKEE